MYVCVQVEAFMRGMIKQIQTGGRRSFFGKKMAASGRDKFTLEDMLSFQRVKFFFSSKWIQARSSAADRYSSFLLLLPCNFVGPFPLSQTVC
jgi:hypothetical protein